MNQFSKNIYEEMVRTNTRANLFDALVGEAEFKRVLTLASGETVLDVGCGTGMFTSYLGSSFSKVIGLDLSSDNIQLAKSRVLSSKNIEFFLGDATSFSFPVKFDTIFLLHLLEHVDNPISVLINIRTHLNPLGKVIVSVPNARSLNRQIGYQMGIIKSLYELSRIESEKFGHQRVYDRDSLSEDIIAAGMKPTLIEGSILKPFTNDQMQLLCAQNGVDWTRKLIDALYEEGKPLSDICSSIILVAEKN